MEILNGHMIPTSEEDIYRGLPFWGILFAVDEDGEEAYVDTIPEDHPITIKDLRRRRKTGEFILRIPQESGEYDEIPFRIEQPKRTRTKQAQEYRVQELRQRYEERIEDLRHDYERHIARLKEEIEQVYRQLQRYQQQVTEQAMQFASEKAHQQEIQSLRDQLHELKAENQIMRLRLEGELAGEDEEEGGLLERLLAGESGAKLIEVLQGMLAGQQQVQAQQQALGDSEPQPQDLNLKQQMIERIFIACTKTLASGEWEKYSRWVAGQIQFMQANGIKLGKEEWINLAYGLAEYAVQHNVTADKIAKLLDPLLGQLGQARQMLKILGPEKAADALATMAGVEISGPIRHIVVETLTYLNNRTETSNAA